MEYKEGKDNFDFNFDNLKKTSPDKFLQNNQNLLEKEDDEIYKEFSHQDFNNFLVSEKNEKEKSNMFDPFNNNKNTDNQQFFVNNFSNQNTNFFENFPNNFQNQNANSNEKNVFNEYVPNNNDNAVDYTQFFNNDLNAPFKNNEDQDKKFFIKKEESGAFDSKSYYN